MQAQKSQGANYSSGAAARSFTICDLTFFAARELYVAMILSASDLIDALGGNHAVAEEFGVQHNTVSTWRGRGFPGWACARLRAMAERGGHQCAATLFDIKPPPRALAAREQAA